MGNRKKLNSPANRLREAKQEGILTADQKVLVNRIPKTKFRPCLTFLSNNMLAVRREMRPGTFNK